MIVEDSLYGRFDVQEPVIIDLLNSPSVLRLKGISQRGYPSFVKENMPVNYTRYEHSVGCMLLLRRLNANIEEQIAGLLHDISHTAFSHVIDWVLGDPSKESYQDETLKEYIINSELPSILQSHGFNSKRISEIEEMDHFGLMERKAPQLCVDRLDYSLRDIHYSLDRDISQFVEGLAVKDNHVVFRSLELANDFAILYARCQREIWGSPNNVVRYHLISIFLKSALEENVIKMPELYKSENEIIGKIRKDGGDEIVRQVDKAFGELHYELVGSGGIKIEKKFRYIDPEFIDGNSVKRVSDADVAYNGYLETERKIETGGIQVRILDD